MDDKTIWLKFFTLALSQNNIKYNDTCERYADECLKRYKDKFDGQIITTTDTEAAEWIEKNKHKVEYYDKLMSLTCPKCLGVNIYKSITFDICICNSCKHEFTC